VSSFVGIPVSRRLRPDTAVPADRRTADRRYQRGTNSAAGFSQCCCSLRLYIETSCYTTASQNRIASLLPLANEAENTHSRQVWASPCITLPKSAPWSGGSGPPSNTWFLGPSRVHVPNGSSIGSSVFAGFTLVTNRLADRPRYTCSNRVTHQLQVERRTGKVRQSETDVLPLCVRHRAAL